MTFQKLDRQQITNWLTGIIVLAWIVSAVVRIWVDWPQAAILDSAMPVIIGYWFVSTAITNGKSGTGVTNGGKHELKGATP